MTLVEILQEIESVKTKLILSIPGSVEHTELTICLIELQNSAIHLLRKVA